MKSIYILLLFFIFNRYNFLGIQNKSYDPDSNSDSDSNGMIKPVLD